MMSFVWLLCFSMLGGVEYVQGVYKKGLYRVEMDGSSQPVEFAALGSGGPNAISVLESELFSRKQNTEIESSDSGQDTASIYIEEAVDIIRKAVKSGIMNDLGSGNSLDICIIKEDGVKKWRERIVDGDDDRLNDGSNISKDGEQGDDDANEFDVNELGECVYSPDKDVQRRTEEIFGVKTGVSVFNLVE